MFIEVSASSDLSDIKLNYPEFRVNYMNIDLEQGIINYKLTVGKLLFRSKLQNVTITRFKGLYVHAAAKLQWVLLVEWNLISWYT